MAYRRFLFACTNRATKSHYMHQMLQYTILHWPTPYRPTLQLHRAASLLIFVLTWLPWGILAGILTTVTGALLLKLTREWQYAVVLVVCGWLPCVLLGIGGMCAAVQMGWAYRAAMVEHRAWRLRRQLVRRRERRREREQMREFSATLAALELRDVESAI